VTSGAVARAWLRAQKVSIVATTPAASATPIWHAPLARPTAIVVGAEPCGLARTWIDAADTLARIPMPGAGARMPGADSLNVAAAGAVILFEALRQRGPA
jgi:tRNA G18 (ribose-2'-O)-methylase SpoU